MSAALPPLPRGYWNPTTELMPRAELAALQLARLNTMVAWAYGRSPFWRRKLDAAKVTTDAISSLDDIRRLPFLTKGELLAEQEAHPPYGELLTAPASVAVAYHQTSGTTGRTPYRAVESARDWSWGANAWARALYAFGLRSTDIVYFPFGYGPFIGFWGAHYAVQRIGATTVPGGAQSSKARIQQMIDVGATAIVATPTYAIGLADTAKEMGIDLARDTRVVMTLHAGEPGPCIPATRALLEGIWGAHAGDFLGMTETAGITAYECSEKTGGLHVSEDYFLEEVLNPETGEPVAMGEVGERVCTAFAIGLMPILRYRTGDLVRRVPGGECPCGRTFDLYQGGVVGRADDMRIIRGTNVYPSAVEGVVRCYPEIREFRIVISGDVKRAEIAVEFDLKPDSAHEVGEQLQPRLAADLADAHEGLRFEVRLVPEGTLPTFELKARRLLDRRQGEQA
jgi:phenylacetate-CoA ligase